MVQKKISCWQWHPASSVFVLVWHTAERWSLWLKLLALEVGKKNQQ